MTVLLWIALAAATGSIPFGVLLARARGVDLRAQGSGNIGATNVTRVLGPTSGLIVLVLDAAKGALPTWLAVHAGAEPTTIVTVGATAIASHCFSPWLGFRGGKGVATTLGVYLVIAPAVTGVGLIAFLVALALTRVPAIGSLVAAATIAVLMALHCPLPYAVFAAIIVGFLLYTHRENLARLLR